MRRSVDGNKGTNTKNFETSAQETIGHILDDLPNFSRFALAYYLISRFPEMTMHMSIPLPVSNSTIEFYGTVNCSRKFGNFDHQVYKDTLGRSFLVRVGDLDESVINISPIPEEFLEIPESVPNETLFEEQCQNLRLVLDEGKEEYLVVGGERFEQDGMIIFKKVEKKK